MQLNSTVNSTVVEIIEVVEISLNALSCELFSIIFNENGVFYIKVYLCSVSAND